MSQWINIQEGCAMPKEGQEVLFVTNDNSFGRTVRYGRYNVDYRV